RLEKASHVQSETCTGDPRLPGRRSAAGPSPSLLLRDPCRGRVGAVGCAPPPSQGAAAVKEDLLSLLPEVSRRELVVTTLAAGFAMAVQPVTAQTITTDAKGLEAGEVKIPTKDGMMPGYRAMPDKGGPFPVVLVVEEIFGVHEHIKDVCRRF